MSILSSEPIELSAIPPFSQKWKEIMKWPHLNVAHPPISFDFADQDQITEVCLIVKLPPPQSPFLPPTPMDPTHLHWSIRWNLGTDGRYDYQRIVELERAAPVLQHLTNWGPVTKFIHPGVAGDTLRIPIATLTLLQRQILERLALTQPVKEPDGVWNCQHWIADILIRATTIDGPVMEVFGSPLITSKQMQTSLDRARSLK